VQVVELFRMNVSTWRILKHFGYNMNLGSTTLNLVGVSARLWTLPSHFLLPTFACVFYSHKENDVIVFFRDNWFKYFYSNKYSSAAYTIILINYHYTINVKELVTEIKIQLYKHG